MENWEKVLQGLRKVSEDLQEKLHPIEETFQRMSDTIRQAAEGLKRISEELPDSIVELTKIGWYVPLFSELKFPIVLKDELAAGNTERVNELMINFINEVYPFYKKKTLEDYPERKGPLEAGFRAHENGEYFLSIPVFFTQIEGICYDQTKNRFFSSREKVPVTKKWVEAVEKTAIVEIFMEPLKIHGPVRKNQDFSNPIGINRHDVLHGNSVDYGTKVNAYKVLSLLFYIGEITLEA
ncbi:MAG: hypothetical protein KDD19_17375 [Phaeodactylibacter sp.]|nr:hypothetical protein [Phaeodactylibacter sp.]